MTVKKLSAENVGLPRYEFDVEEQPNVFDLSSHQRAHEAIVMGLDRPGSQYNIYVLGPDQAGRMTATMAYIESWASDYPVADDWLYLLDFNAPNSPRPAAVPNAMGAKFRDAVAELIPSLASSLAGAFSSEAYQHQVEALKASGDRQIQARSQALEATARAAGLTIVPTANGPMLAALGENGEPVALHSLPKEDQERLSSQSAEIIDSLGEINRDALRAQQRFIEAIRELDSEVARHASQALIEATARAFENIKLVNDWFVALAADVVEHRALFLLPEQPVPTADPSRALRRYAVNLLVDRSQEKHRPVVVEHNPTHENLFGKIEYRQVAGGGLETDVSLVKPGSLHRANGGVLILRANDIAEQPGVWSFLKAALRDGEIRIEEFYRAGSPPLAGAPRPVPVPLDLNVVLIGPPSWYHTFFAVDPEFSNYFKVKAHIEPIVEATNDNLAVYAGLLARHAKAQGVVVEHEALQLLMGIGARWAGQREWITTQFEAVCDVITEACAHCSVIDADAIRGAVVARRRRNSHVEDSVHRSIRNKQTIISVTGSTVGQINGLTVQDVGDHVFGSPSRLTARASPGRRGVINVERMVSMSGPIQQKSSMVLQGLLARRFARHAPTSFDCSVTFEQLYGGVEGDSASLAEYVAIISDLADVPVRQDLAITGSVNQLGEAQVIGGLHHKVEGFFRVCQELGGLTGEQGVILPARNEQHLVLRDDVTAAVKEGQFSLYSIEHIDEAVELFTGMPVGDAAQPSDDTVYGRVVKTLIEFDQALAQRTL